MDVVTATLVSGLLAGLLSGVVSVLIANRHYRNYEKRKMKLDTVRDFFANRFDVTGDGFSRTLNELAIVFADSPAVQTALAAFHSSRSNENLARLTRAMCGDVNIDTSKLSDEFLLTPFNTRQSTAALPQPQPSLELPRGNPR